MAAVSITDDCIFIYLILFAIGNVGVKMLNISTGDYRHHTILVGTHY